MCDVEDRLNRLERTNRWLWLALLVALAAPLLTEFFGRPAIGVEPKTSRFDKLEVKELDVGILKALSIDSGVIVAKGNGGAILLNAMMSRGAYIHIETPEGKPRVNLQVSKVKEAWAGTVGVVDDAGDSRTGLSYVPKLGGGLLIQTKGAKSHPSSVIVGE